MKTLPICALLVALLSACSENDKIETIPIRVESFRTETGRYVPAVADGGVLYIIDTQTGRAYFRDTSSFGNAIRSIDYVKQ